MEIRQQLIEQGALGKVAIRASTLVAKDLTKAEARLAESYEPGDVVIFNQRDTDRGIQRGAAFTVAATEPREGRVSLMSAQGKKLEWAPGQWGQTEGFVLASREFREGDRIEFTRNDHAAGRANGAQAEVTRVLDRQSIEVQRVDGRLEVLALDAARDQHIRHAYVQTTHAAQGRTADRVMVHAESGRANLIDQASIYVALSRARLEAGVYTDNRGKLAAGVAEREARPAVALHVEAGRGRA